MLLSRFALFIYFSVVNLHELIFLLKEHILLLFCSWFIWQKPTNHKTAPNWSWFIVSWCRFWPTVYYHPYSTLLDWKPVQAWNLSTVAREWTADGLIAVAQWQSISRYGIPKKITLTDWKNGRVHQVKDTDQSGTSESSGIQTKHKADEKIDEKSSTMNNPKVNLVIAQHQPDHEMII